MDAETYKDLF